MLPLNVINIARPTGEVTPRAARQACHRAHKAPDAGARLRGPFPRPRLGAGRSLWVRPVAIYREGLAAPGDGPIGRKRGFSVW